MSPPHGRGWDYVGHGYAPVSDVVSRLASRALKELDYMTRSRDIVGECRQEFPPSGGWFEYRMSATRARRLSRITGRFIAAEDAW